MENMSLFDFMEKHEAEEWLAKKSTDWKWTFADYPEEKNGLKVFSCFACGGGSTMGYKLAGCEVLGCCEIDPKMNEIYKKNHNPKYNFLMDIRDFNKLPTEEIPQDLFDLDVLDGSPPCTTFSMSGDREESWGKKKKFREGQAEQTLDDLSFVFIETVKKLRPKTVVMENVEGLLLGKAWGYVQEIYRHFDEAGYNVKHWLCKGELMGIPQTRHRVFFVAVRKDIKFDLQKLDMSFNYAPVTYGEIKDGKGKKASEKAFALLNEAKSNERYLNEAHKRLYGKDSWFNHALCQNDNVVPTIAAGHSSMWDYENKTSISNMDIIHAQTFPEDYDFIKNTFGNINYICGMSVPPVMTKRIMLRLIESGLYDYKKDNIPLS